MVVTRNHAKTLNEMGYARVNSFTFKKESIYLKHKNVSDRNLNAADAIMF